MSPRVLVAGIGNVFLGDDGFGVAVAQRLAAAPLPEGVVVSDVGIRALHLAFALLERPELLVVVDTVSRGQPPGTLYLIEPDLDRELPPGNVPDAHAMNLQSVRTALRSLGGELPPTFLVGCEPASIGEQMSLSDVVERAIPAAVRMVQQLIAQQLGDTDVSVAKEGPDELPGAQNTQT